MKTIDKIRVMSMEKVVESTLDKNKKMKTLKFLKEDASIYQCMGFILDEKLYNLDSIDNEIIKERFINEQGRATKYRKTTHSLYYPVGAGLNLGAAAAYKLSGSKSKVGDKIYKNITAKNRTLPPRVAKVLNRSLSKHYLLGAISGIVTWTGYRAIRSFFDNCTKQCGTFKINTPKRQECLYKCQQSTLLKIKSSPEYKKLSQVQKDKIDKKIYNLKIKLGNL